MGVVIKGTWLLTLAAVIGLLALLLFGVMPGRQRLAYFPAALMTIAAACEDWKTGEIGGPQPALDDFEANWFGGHLLAGGEASLYAQSRRDPALQSYRFTFLPSFGHPVMVRVEEQAVGAPMLTAKKLSGYGGYAPGEVSEQQVRRLTASEAALFHKALQMARIDTLAPSNCRAGADGSQWIIEANDHGRYVYVSRWSPQGGLVRELGMAFLALPGWSENHRPT